MDSTVAVLLYALIGVFFCLFEAKAIQYYPWWCVVVVMLWPVVVVVRGLQAARGALSN